MNFKEKRPLYLLKEIASILRAEGGCAWDREQTSLSLRPYLIEEAYEVYDAIESGDRVHMQEELGDLLYQVYAHAQIADEEGSFTVDDVAQGIADKLIRRHPHVFGESAALSPDQVSDRWEQIKKEEKPERKSILEGVPRHLPALLKAYRVQQKAARVGFDWEKVEDAALKLDEEIGELKEVIARRDDMSREDLVEEAGDILFSVVNVLRYLKVNPEEALVQTIGKFMDRFGHVERRTAEMGKKMEEMSLAELDELWDEAKDAARG